MHPTKSFVLLFAVLGSALAADEAPVFEETFSSPTLAPVWRISGNKTQASLEGERISLTAQVEKENNLTQIVYTDPTLWFLSPDTRVRVRTDVSVRPAAKDAVGRIVLSSAPGNALKGSAIVLQINGQNAFRVQIIREGTPVSKAPNWKPVSGTITRAELEAGPTAYTARVWSEASETPEEITGEHGLDAAIWGTNGQASLALGAWTSGGTDPTTVTFDNLQIFTSH